MTQLPASAIRACRKALDTLEADPKSSHAGLLLNRYLKAHKPTRSEERSKLDETPEENLLENVARIQVTEVYRRVFKQWKEMLDRRGCKTFNAELAASLAVGLGNESPLEVGLTLHHTYGMPIIPGSAIKGMCRRGAELLKGENKIDDEQFKVLFGDQKSASCFTFWDAWYNPNAVDGQPFHRDVITVHHPKYYQKGSAWPTDFDDPTPVPFLVVKPGAEFLFALDAPNQQWCEFVEKLLKWCLQHLGIGGKTSAGYGYFVGTNSTQLDGGQNKPAEAISTPTIPITISAVTKAIPAKVVDNSQKPIKVQLLVPGYESDTYTCGGASNLEAFPKGKRILVDVVDYDKKGKRIRMLGNPKILP